MIVFFAILVVILVAWAIRDEILDAGREPDLIAYHDGDELVELPVPAGWVWADVWVTLAEIDALPEAAGV